MSIWPVVAEGGEATLARMRAWQLTDTTGIDAYELVDVPEPEPGPGEVRVALKTVRRKHLDLWVAEGTPAPKVRRRIRRSAEAGVGGGFGEGGAGFEIADEVIVRPTMPCGRCARCRSAEPVYCDECEIRGEGIPGTLTEKIVIPT